MSTLAIILIILGAIVVLSFLIFAFVKFGLPQLKKFLKERKEKKENKKIVCVQTKIVVKDNVAEIIKESPIKSMADLEKICDDNPIIVVDVDNDTKEFSNYSTIKSDEFSDDFKMYMRDNAKEGILVFE